MAPLELWGGVECTINRTGDVWHDQLAANGHRDRPGDLELFAHMGIRSLRQAVLWERHTEPADWSASDAALHKIRALGVEPIIGLVHHGSGPAGTSLIDECFAPGLAAHAARVAARYPWVERYTPVNEPLTTARFSGLYGLWYPHGKSSRLFARALLNQCRAIVLAMRAIRAINPAAQLIQTEDLGRASATAPLRYQADLENERRWLTWDLLCGRVTSDAMMGKLLLASGITPRELGWFLDNPCPPDVVGINHYVTSDRFLDHRLERYPDLEPGGNARDRYVDTEAVRVLECPDDGWLRSLTEASARYGLPVAITEAHLGSTREEQLRWFASAWEAAQIARAEGQDVRAVTAWALLGSNDWNSLLTRCVGHYEPGVFDLRSGTPRPTALVAALRNLAQGGGEDVHPATAGPGWWSRPGRLFHPRPEAASARKLPRSWQQKVLLVAGAGGNLANAIAQGCEQRGIGFRTLGRAELDICSPAQISKVLTSQRPWALINAAGYVRVDDAEREDARCHRENYDGPTRLAEACEALNVRLATFSSDLVFDGESASSYTESSPVGPLNSYGRSKALAEAAVLRLNPEALVIRTSAFFGPWHPHDFLPLALRVLGAGQKFDAMDDVVVSHTYVPDLVDASLDLLIDGEKGIWHLANQGPLSWYAFAQHGAEVCGVDSRRLAGRPCADFNLPAMRPRFSALGTERGMMLPTLHNALERYAAQRMRVAMTGSPRMTSAT